MKAQPTLLCIPDISGFTRFMSETNFELGSKVIPSLLNKIVYSNELGLKISEIEGDAVLFYRTGTLPSLPSLIDQCHYFQSEFYKQLHTLKARYRENDSANIIPEILGLKIILHYGKEVGQVAVGKHIKLIGEDVIKAHLLLKNSIEQDEYILLSRQLLEQYNTSQQAYKPSLNQLKNGEITDDNLGKIPFSYIEITP